MVDHPFGVEDGSSGDGGREGRVGLDEVDEELGSTSEQSVDDLGLVSVGEGEVVGTALNKEVSVGVAEGREGLLDVELVREEFRGAKE